MSLGSLPLADIERAPDEVVDAILASEAEITGTPEADEAAVRGTTGAGYDHEQRTGRAEAWSKGVEQQLIDTLDACNNEVHALRRRTHALAGSQPRLAVGRSKARHAADSVGRIDDFFDNGVLDLLPERVEANTPVELAIPVATLQSGHGSFQEARRRGGGEGSHPTAAETVGSLPNR